MNKLLILPLTSLIILIVSFSTGILKIPGKRSESGSTAYLSDSINRINSKKPLDYIRLHYDAIVVDSHNDFVWKMLDKGASFGTMNSFTQSDLPRLKAGGVDVQIYSIWQPLSRLKKAYSFTLGQIQRLKSIQQENPGAIEFGNNYDDISRITGQGKLCAFIGIEGGNAVENDLDNVNRFYEMGVRYIGLTWNNSNQIASSAQDETEKGKGGGLTQFGIQVVKRMDEVGMLIDVSHLGEQSFWDVINTSSNPIFASHSDCYSLSPHFRNLKDDQIKAIAGRNGVIMINFYTDFLDKDAVKASENIRERYSLELRELYEKYQNDLVQFNLERDKLLAGVNIQGGVSIDKVIEHIDYIRNLVGADFIGLGSDFDGGITPPNELYDASCYPLITKKLVEKNYTEEEIRKILGLNFLRVFKQVCR
jgi:membrane dipeptidase